MAEDARGRGMIKVNGRVEEERKGKKWKRIWKRGGWVRRRNVKDDRKGRRMRTEAVITV